MELSELFKEYLKEIKKIVKNLDEKVEKGDDIVLDMLLFLLTSEGFTSEYNKLITNEMNKEEK